MTETQRLREQQVLLNLKTFDLSFEHVDILKKTNSWQGYHNIQHLFVVALRSLEGARFYQLPVPQQKNLFLSGLYHDCDHSGDSSLPDQSNIELAVAGFQKSAAFEASQVDDASVQEIIALIRATIHPNPSPPNSLAEKIIRDSDMLQWLEVDALEALDGLNREQQPEVPHTWVSTLAFLRNQTIHTEWANGLLEEILLPS